MIYLSERDGPLSGSSLASSPILYSSFLVWYAESLEPHPCRTALPFFSSQSSVHALVGLGYLTDCLLQYLLPQRIRLLFLSPD